ncbi:hypothetical protein CSTERLE_08450 [Thermoclostridium stercorarium subsp. leptospartum DSM 9219]|uniref:HTH cro/C1-type domain-containing protein n=1 Tax=Thermoclostridium stercorarium subsp. leptospartum DSM 9219 TaxID=1346611 RepID=A0A1B1YLI3_THEST|nr:helix-turn-helix transcriptional regulator [Thermoclostridium stercorarium]ANX01603.1 hypothetical protein CSTERLE_08450 [Thermoclostridium stercorarium subsp. leptospartum DSM 9219]
MDVYLTFGECLAAILKALDLKSNKLAKEINVDPSLIYKWIREERVPSYDTPYIELISNSVANKISNSFQKEAVINLLHSHGIEIKETVTTEELKNKIKLWLTEAQGYSIKLYKQAKIKRANTLFTASGIHGAVRYNDNNSRKYAGRLNMTNISLDESGHFGVTTDYIQVINGETEVINSALRLLKQARRKPNSDDKILITLNSEMNILLNNTDLKNKWLHILNDILGYGWTVIFLIGLNDNCQRTIKIVEYLQALLSCGNLYVFYHKVNDNILFLNELCIVPHIGALLCFSSKIGQQVDRAFWYHEKESIEILTSYFFQQLTFSKPLMKTYPSQKTIEFQQVLVEEEEFPGDRYVFKNGLSTITIPLDLYKKYLKFGNRTSQEISYREFLHKIRLESFEAQVRYYEYKDICFVESLEKLVRYKKYAPDEYYMLENRIPDNGDIVYHLENLINMLRKHENYEIAFVNKHDFNNLSNICWLVKGNSSVFIETLNKNGGVFENNPEKINNIITEKSIVNGFRDCFLKIWNHIPDENKNKRNTINFLQSLIEKCNTDDNVE